MLPETHIAKTWARHQLIGFGIISVGRKNLHITSSSCDFTKEVLAIEDMMSLLIHWLIYSLYKLMYEKAQLIKVFSAMIQTLPAQKTAFTSTLSKCMCQGNRWHFIIAVSISIYLAVFAWNSPSDHGHCEVRGDINSNLLRIWVLVFWLNPVPIFWT